VAAWRWTVTTTAAACDAEVERTDAADLEVVFWCPGTFEVTLAATDSHGVTGPPARRTIDVAAAATGLPTVSTGSTVAVAHRCLGEPLRCELAAPVTVTASGSGGQGALAYAWKALPPAADRAGAQVALTPAGAATAQAVAITTPGTAISGRWSFRVRVEDADGNLAQAIQVVEVGNRPPVVTGAALAFDHRYEGGAYLAGGPVAFEVSDPDGDPVTTDLSAVEPAGSGCRAGLAPAGAAAAAWDLRCTDPAFLLAAGREVRAVATDVNGGSAEAASPIAVKNRPPVVRPAGDPLAVEVALDHGVGPCPAQSGSCFFVLGAAPFEAVDPDGDPLPEVALEAVVLPGHPASTGEVGQGPGGAFFRFSTPAGKPAEFRALDGASGFVVRGRVSDPFAAAAPAELAVRVLNRAPVLKVAVPALTVPHQYDPATSDYAAVASLATFEDPDGDPLIDTGSGLDSGCLPGGIAGGTVTVECHLPFALAAGGTPPLATLAGARDVTARVQDGWAPAFATTHLAIANRAPALAAFAGTVESCTCRCAKEDANGNCLGGFKWAPDTVNVKVPVAVTEGDGDPLRVAYAPRGAAPPLPSKTALAAACGATVANPAFPVSWDVTVDDGVATATANTTVTGVTCAAQGQACTP
jgi:hypothetical protein